MINQNVKQTTKFSIFDQGAIGSAKALIITNWQTFLGRLFYEHIVSRLRLCCTKDRNRSMFNKSIQIKIHLYTKSMSLYAILDHRL